MFAGSRQAHDFGTISGMARPPRPDSAEAIGERLRLIRIAYGTAQGHDREMSQAEVCRLTGVGRQAWNNAETGDNRIGIDNAMSIVRSIGVSLDYIYFGDRRGLPHALAVEIDKLQNAHAKRA